MREEQEAEMPADLHVAERELAQEWTEPISSSEHRMHDRADEVGFRIGVPDSVTMFRVLEVRRFQAGSERDGTLPHAIALSRMGRSNEWATHVIVHDPDNAEYPWSLFHGRYFNNEKAAREDLEKRWP